jgi:hypothetical protein
MNGYVKFCGNLRTQMENQLIVKKISTFSVENLDSTCTAHEHAFNTVYNTDTHALLDTTNTVEPESITIFGNGVKTEVNSP